MRGCLFVIYCFVVRLPLLLLAVMIWPISPEIEEWALRKAGL